MDEKLDFQKKYRELYLPRKGTVSRVTVPLLRYLAVDGTGAPESQDYQQSVQILYTLAFTIKMSKLHPVQPMGYVDFRVPPLEGLWDCAGSGFDPNRDAWSWTSMLCMPEFVTEETVAWAVEEARKKHPELPLGRARLFLYDEGRCAQLLHFGPYTAEQASIDRLGDFIREQGLRDDCGAVRRHHEIYLSDPRRTQPDRLRTVLRHPVRP